MDSDSDHEDYVSYGTPLEVIEEDEPLPKPIAVKDQVVRDRQGRQRFHGAFTGGFSAGFFNTVGSKEGFTPSTFVSTREKRAEKQTQRAEDFMDVDDMGEFGIAPRKVVTTAKFAGDESGARKRPGPSPGSTIIPDDGRIQDLIKPADDTIGMKLLRKMGWKPGQGIGPKIERRKKKKKKGKGKVYGCARPPVTGDDEADDSGDKAEDSDVPSGGESDSDEDEDDFMRGFLFAPDDVQDFIFALKDDVHGIGYHGMDSSKSILGGHVTLFDEPVTSRNRRQGIKGHAFGIGAFEEEDDDVYSSDRLSNYDRVLGGEEEAGRQLYGWTAPSTHHRGSDDVLDGFKAASKKKLTPKVFHPPALPRDFRPFHHFRSTTPAVPGPVMGAPSGSRFTLSADQRAAMLGEERLPADKPLPSEDLARIKAFRDQSAPPHKASQKAEEKRGSRWDRGAPQAPLGSAEGWSASGFKPFEKNPEKQQRYEAFLKSQQRGSVPGDSRTEWERQQEQEEFARAAALYRPMSGMMASRFVSAKHSDADDTVEVQAEAGGDENDQSKAAEMKMFGQLTRDSLEWHPDKLLCKRFNVADPYPGSTTVGLPTVKKDKFSVFNFLEIQQPASLEIQTFPSLQGTGKEKSQDGLQGPGSLSSSHQKKSRWDQHPGILAVIGSRDREEGKEEEQEKEENVAKTRPSETGQNTTSTSMATEDEEKPRPPMDLFQAIFLDSDTESDDDDDDEDNDDDEDGSEESKGKLVKSDGNRAEEMIKHEDAGIPKSSPIGDKGASDSTTVPMTVGGTQPDFSSSLLPSSVALNANDNSTDGGTSTGGNDMENRISDGSDEDIYGPRLPPQPDQDQRGPAPSTAAPSARLSTTDQRHEKESDGRREREGRWKDRREGKKKKKKREKKDDHHRSRERERGKHKKESHSRRDSTSGRKKHKGNKKKYKHHKRQKPSHHRPSNLGKQEMASSSDYDASQSSDNGR